MAENNFSTKSKFELIQDDTVVETIKFVNTFRQILAVALGFIHYVAGSMVGMFGINLIIQLRRQHIEVSPDEASWITSIYLLPMGPVCFITGFVMHRIPKRYLLITSFTLEIIGWMIQYFYVETAVMAAIIGRSIIGVAIAIISPIIPLYLAEVTHPNYRGVCIAFVYMGMSVGYMTGNIISALSTWKVYILISTGLTLISLILTFCLKETYPWHMKKSDIYHVKESFYWYRGRTEEAKLEISKYIADHCQNTHDILPKSSFFTNFRSNMNQLALPLAITVILMATMHLSGYKVIILYSIHILGAVLPSVNVYIITISMDAFRLLANIAACILVKKYPVRLLLMISGIGTAISHAIFCILKHFSYVSENVFAILCLVTLATFITFATIGLGSLPFVVCGEIFPLEVKNIGCGISLFAYYGIYFLVIKYVSFLEGSVGVIGEFVVFGCCTTIGTIIIYFFMPETKNKTLGDIENSLKSLKSLKF